MSKPLGLAFVIGPDGSPSLRVSQPSRVEDLIWDAVEAAIDAGWTARDFRIEVADAWEQRLRDEAKWARDDLLAD